MSQLLYVVIASAPSGDRVAGVFSGADKAFGHIPPEEERDGATYRVEYHVLDEPVDPYGPWWLVMAKDGTLDHAADAPSCICDDDCYIEPGGRRMHIIVWARSEERATEVADSYRRWLVESGIWQDEPLQLAMLHTEDRAAN